MDFFCIRKDFLKLAHILPQAAILQYIYDRWIENDKKPVFIRDLEIIQAVKLRMPHIIRFKKWNKEYKFVKHYINVPKGKIEAPKQYWVVNEERLQRAIEELNKSDYSRINKKIINKLEVNDETGDSTTP